MLQNTTLDVDKHLIFKAGKKVQSEHDTAPHINKEYSSLMDRLSYAKPSGRYSRDELNER